MPRKIKLPAKPAAKPAKPSSSTAATPTPSDASAASTAVASAAGTAKRNDLRKQREASKPDIQAKLAKQLAANKPSKPGKAAKADKPSDDKPTADNRFHDIPRAEQSYAGPSPNFRIGARLTPLAEPGTRSFGPPTGRDDDLLRDLRKRYGNKPFPRLNGDAGTLNRLTFYRFIEHLDGELSSPMLQLRVTPLGMQRKL